MTSLDISSPPRRKRDLVRKIFSFKRPPPPGPLQPSGGNWPALPAQVNVTRDATQNNDYPDPPTAFTSLNVTVPSAGTLESTSQNNSRRVLVHGANRTRQGTTACQSPGADSFRSHSVRRLHTLIASYHRTIGTKFRWYILWRTSPQN
jgi:hypothetical protein